MNIVMTESGKFIEIQGTAEEQPFSRDQFNEMLNLAEKGLKEIFELQHNIINDNVDKTSRPKRINPNKGIGSMGDALSDIKL